MNVEVPSSSPRVVITEPHRTPLVLSIVEPVQIGRDCAGLILLDTSISRRHVLVQPAGDAVLVSDLGSLNGSTVDDRPLVDGHRLAPGEVVRFGGCTLVLVPPRRASSGATGGPTGRFAEAELERWSTMSQPNRAGNVSMVFCGIEGSGERAIELGVARWGEVLSVHHRIMQTILERQQATASFALEDGLMACFVSARSAVGFVIDNHRALAAFEAANPTEGCRVRAGVHTADVAFDDESFGRLVAMTDGIAAQASGGEILVSSVVREIVEQRGGIVFGESRSTTLQGARGRHLLHLIVC